MLIFYLLLLSLSLFSLNFIFKGGNIVSIVNFNASSSILGIYYLSNIEDSSIQGLVFISRSQTFKSSSTMKS